VATVSDAPDAVGGVLYGRENAAGVVVENSSRGSQVDLPGGPSEQVGPKLALQLANRLRQRGLRDVQVFGRLSEMAGFGDSDKVAQMPEFQGFLHADTQDAEPDRHERDPNTASPDCHLVVIRGDQNVCVASS
jgi:hypothetical protein